MAKQSLIKDPRGGHVRLYWDLMDSAAWRSLTPGEQRCYLALLRSKGRTNNGDLSLPLSVARHHGIKSHTTLAAGLRALQAVGLIAITRKGGCTRGGQRLPTLYRITDEECNEHKTKFVEACKATKDWKQIATIAQGKALIKAAHQRAKQDKQDEEQQQAAERGSLRIVKVAA